MSTELIAILGVGATLLVAGIAAVNILVSSLRALRSDFASMQSDLTSLTERVARIEGILSILVPRIQRRSDAERRIARPKSRTAGERISTANP